MGLSNICVARRRIFLAGCGLWAAELPYLIILPIPIHKLFNAHFQRSAWLEPRVPCQVRDIRAGGFHIPRLHGQQFLVGLFAQTQLQYLDESQELFRLMIPGRSGGQSY